VFAAVGHRALTNLHDRHVGAHEHDVGHLVAGGGIAHCAREHALRELDDLVATRESRPEERMATGNVGP
jgi:hypothetical protein